MNLITLLENTFNPEGDYCSESWAQAGKLGGRHLLNGFDLHKVSYTFTDLVNITGPWSYEGGKVSHCILKGGVCMCECMRQSHHSNPLIYGPKV